MRLLAGLLLLWSAPAAADDAAQALVDAVQANFEAIQTISCSVTTTATVTYTRTAVAGRVTTTHYRYWLKRPDKLRVETPDGNALVRDGARAWRFTPDGGSVELAGSAVAAPCALPPVILWNFREALAGLNLIISGAVSGRQVLEAWPAGPVTGSGQAAHREFWVGANGTVDRIRLYDPSGWAYHRMSITSRVVGEISVPGIVEETFLSPANTTAIRHEFAAVRLNEELPDSLFAP